MPTPEAQKAADDVFICATDRETRHNIALALDRFAAQYDDEISAEQIAALNRIVPDAAFADHETIPGPAWGSGDAGDRARAIAVRIIETDFGDEPADPITLISAWIEAALRSSHQEGAEATREADARACSERGAWAESKIADDKDDVWATYSNACDDCAEIVRALPIPGKTDAG